jgi:hypothetical protein
MNDPEGFLSRWARRKRDAGREEATPGDREALASAEDAVTEVSPDNAADEKPIDAVQEEPAFDLSKLPSIESITAETDIRPFLARGVPADLRQEALRRAWVADPHIRDFIGIAENQGDFTGAGETMPGFDFSPPTGDIARMVAEIFGEKRNEPASNDKSEGEVTAVGTEENTVDDSSGDHRNVTPTVTDAVTGSASPEAVADAQSVRLNFAERVEADAAPQKDSGAQEEKISISRRSHGGAMPK